MKLTIASSDATPITTAANTSIIAAPGAEKHLAIYKIWAVNSGATVTRIAFRDGAAGALLWPCYLQQYQPFSLTLSQPYKRIREDEGPTNDELGRVIGSKFLLTANTALYLNTSATGEIHWTVAYKILDLWGHEV